MIGKSDLIILGVATLALTIGVGRWYVNTQAVNSVTIPASARSSIEADRSADQDRSRFTGFVQVGERSAGQRDTQRERLPDQAAADTSPAVSDSPPEPAEPAEPDYGVHTVRSGDYLGLLANRFNTSVSELQSLNDIDGTTIHVGDEIRYPQ